MKNPSRAIVTVSACGIFAEPTFKSEMVSQALLNEEVVISSKKDNWCEIRLEYDGYSGWIHNMYLEENRKIDDARDFHNKFLKNPILIQASKMLGKPYLWGGRSFQGYDCSGLVQTSMSLCGISFPRDAKDQAVSDLLYEVKVKDAIEGDLLFFEEKDVVNHVAIVAKNEYLMSKSLQIIHASGNVKISEIIFDASFHGLVDGKEEKKIKLYKIMRLKKCMIF